MAPLLLAVGIGATLADDETATLLDSIGDAVARRTDPGADGPFDPQAHRLIDVWELTIGTWSPEDPQDDLFTGSFDDDGDFVRLDLWLGGLVNPPGRTHPWDFEPFVFGPHPVFGFIEVDMDRDVETGGELDAPEYHFLGNIVRFGGKPAGDEFDDRVALDGSAFDGDFLTPPFVERQGEEFHLALLGSELGQEDVQEIVGDGDLIFEAGETWQITAAWLHRAHGYEPFSLAQGGSQPGEYMPAGTLRFRHDAAADATLISLVFPLTNIGAGAMVDEDPQPPNGDPSDHASVREGLLDLRDSALFLRDFPTGLPEEAIITAWAEKDPDDYLEPAEWRLTVLAGTSYTTADPSGEYFVWTDSYPDVVRGDVDGDGEAEHEDEQSIEQFIADEDANDGDVDGRVVISNFALDFNVFDINHNGVVDALDEMLVSAVGDLDGDEDIDLVDFAAFQTCFSGSGNPFEPLGCGLGDLDADGDVDFDDFGRFERAVTGPESE